MVAPAGMRACVSYNFVEASIVLASMYGHPARSPQITARPQLLLSTRTTRTKGSVYNNLKSARRG